MDDNEFGDLFGEESELDRIIREEEEEILSRRLKLEDAQYTIETMKEYGLRVWFRACKFTKIEEAIKVIEWCEAVLSAPDVEAYEDCAFLRDQRQWLESRSHEMEIEEAVGKLE